MTEGPTPDADGELPPPSMMPPPPIIFAPVSGAGDTIKQIRALVEEHFRPEIDTITDPVSGEEALVMIDERVSPVPASVFDDYLAQPRFRRGTAELTTLDSLIDHANRFKDSGSVVFACDDRTKPSITTVIDYHPAGSEEDAQPRHGRHRGHFAFPLCDEWKAWTKFNGQKMSMADFAVFLDERIIDVLHLIEDEDELSEDLKKYVATAGGNHLIATPLRLVELSRGLQVNENSAVSEAINLSSGEGQISFQSEHVDKHGLALRVPTMFLIAIPVFRKGALYRIAARLRYRKTTAGIVFWYDLWRLDRTFDHAFTEACERVKAETGLPLLFGAPE